MLEAHMSSGRREFLSHLTLGALGVAALDVLNPAPLHPQQAAGFWDLRWVGKLTGKYKAVFDIPVIEDGYGVWRAIIWRKQYAQIFGIPESEMSAVINLRHDAIALALNQEFWSKYGSGNEWQVRDPLTRERTSRNPVIERTGTYALPSEYSDYSLEAQMESGAVVLACALALRDCATILSREEGVDIEEADRRVRQMLVPGVILQPSGIFSAVLAQDNGCQFVRAS
jgi:hypothetical protein